MHDFFLPFAGMDVMWFAVEIWEILKLSVNAEVWTHWPRSLLPLLRS